MILRFAILLLFGGCLSVGCSATLESPADAFGVSKQSDRTLELRKNWFGASAKIPLTDFTGTGKVKYDKETGNFEAEVTVDQNWSNTLALENARIKENQELYLALTTAQQEVFDRRIDAWKDVGVHGIDAAAQAIGLLAAMPGGTEPASDMIGSITGKLGPQMLPVLIEALAKRGVTLTPKIVAPIPTPNDPVNTILSLWKSLPEAERSALLTTITSTASPPVNP